MSGGAGHHRGTSKQNYATPEVFLAAVCVKLGIEGFLHDFAAEAGNSVASCYYDKETDALAQSPEDWALQVKGGWGWLNPEFDDILPWADMCRMASDEGAHIAFLVPAAVGSNWWRDCVDGDAQVLLLNGRVPFDPDRPHWGYPKDLALCLYAPNIPLTYEVWRWWDDVPPEMFQAFKQRCTEARAVEAAARKAAR